MEIPCSFEAVTQWYGIFEEGETKLGRYDGTNMNIKGLGYDKWALVANILLNDPVQKYLEEGLTEEQILVGCLEFLNKPPTKRSRKPKYGHLEHRYFKLLDGEKITVSLTTTDRNNKHFWGRGSKAREVRKISKRGRPRKRK